MVETYIYYHKQSPGYQARRVKRHAGRKIWDVSKYFGVSKYGSLRAARIKARNWKKRNL